MATEVGQPGLAPTSHLYRRKQGFGCACCGPASHGRPAPPTIHPAVAGSDRLGLGGGAAALGSWLRSRGRRRRRPCAPRQHQVRRHQEHRPSRVQVRPARGGGAWLGACGARQRSWWSRRLRDPAPPAGRGTCRRPSRQPGARATGTAAPRSIPRSKVVSRAPLGFRRTRPKRPTPAHSSAAATHKSQRLHSVPRRSSPASPLRALATRRAVSLSVPGWTFCTIRHWLNVAGVVPELLQRLVVSTSGPSKRLRDASPAPP